MTVRQYHTIVLWISRPGRSRQRQYHPYRLHAKRAEVLDITGRWPEAIAVHQHNREWAESRQDPGLTAESLACLGQLLSGQGRFPESIRRLRQACDLYAGLGESRERCQALSWLGQAYYESGDLASAMDAQRQALALADRLGDAATAGDIMGNIGNIHFDLGEPGQALECQRQCLAASETAGDLYASCITQSNIGHVHYRRGEMDAALQRYQQSLEQAHRIGYRKGIGLTTGTMGNIHYRRGQFDAALDCYRTSLKIADGMGDRLGSAVASGNIGNAYAGCGDLAAAEAYLTRAVSQLRELDQKPLLTHYVYFIAGLFLRLRDQRRAAQHCSEAMALAAEVGDQRVMFLLRIMEASIAGLDGSRRGLDMLARLETSATTDHQKAALYFELYRAGRGAAHRAAALEYNRKLYAQSSGFEYRERLDELGDPTATDRS